MKYPEITRLYKFYNYNEQALSVLINKTVWFAKPESLNDPFDCKIFFDNSINLQELQNFLPRYMNFKGISEKQLEEEMQEIRGSRGQLDPEFIKIWGTVLKAADEQLTNSGVFCLSQCNDNILMWAHYADNHKGFCIEFERSSQNDLGDYEKTRDVKYRPDYPTISPLSPYAFDLKFFTKAIDWKYEKEWILINEKGDIALPLPGDISAIIFGLKMSSQNKTTIKNILFDNPNIMYRQAEKVPNSFKLKIVYCESNHSLKHDG